MAEDKGKLVTSNTVCAKEQMRKLILSLYSTTRPCHFYNVSYIAVLVLQMISKMFENMDCSHAKFMKQQQNKILDFSTALDDKLTTQGTELSNWNDKTVEELKALQQQVDKFLTKDGLRRDVSTGSFFFYYYLSA